LLVIDPRFEIFALQHLLQRHPTIESNNVFKRHGSKPVAIADRFRPRRIENFKSLLPVSHRIRLDFCAREVRPRHRPTARITNHPREIADNENCLVAQVLKLPQLLQNDCVPKVNIGGGWIDA
jgi:hypothetical protein